MGKQNSSKIIEYKESKAQKHLMQNDCNRSFVSKNRKKIN
jgi:hypothetical protein